MKKTVCMILCFAMLVGLLAGCGKPEPEPGFSGEAATTEETTSETTEATSTMALDTTAGTIVMTRPPETSDTSDTTSDTYRPETTRTTEPTAPETTAPTEVSTTALTAMPMLGDIETVSGVLTVGACAMEYHYASYDGLRKYAEYIMGVKSYLTDVDFYAMYIPVAISLYCPEGVNPGSDQEEVMNDWYDMMPGVTGVNTLSELEAHKDEYLYFRTDTHWTQRGGYYAFKAFCEASGFVAPRLDDYEYAASTGYLGYMYTILKGTNVGNLMSANPDTVERFKPVSNLTARAYYDPSMTGGGFEISVVNMESGNYYAFTQGDQPLIHIKNNDVKNGKIAILTKDSYGNTLVPFLADCYEELYVVDQRHFNTDSTYSLNIVSFAQIHGVTDFIVEANAFNASAASSNFGRLLP